MRARTRGKRKDKHVVFKLLLLKQRKTAQKWHERGVWRGVEIFQAAVECKRVRPFPPLWSERINTNRSWTNSPDHIRTAHWKTTDTHNASCYKSMTFSWETVFWFLWKGLLHFQKHWISLFLCKLAHERPAVLLQEAHEHECRNLVTVSESLHQAPSYGGQNRSKNLAQREQKFCSCTI